jgi:GNAT superfamily N-acetyltransferase
VLVEEIGSRPHGDLAGLMSAWVRGWVISRAAPAPAAVPGGWRVDVGLHAHRVRYVLHDPDEQTLTWLGRHQNGPGTWIKIAGDPTRLRAALPPEWKHADTGYLMTTTYQSASDTTPPSPYTARLQTSGDVVTAVILDPERQVAASGKLTTADMFGIVDQVETTPAHRRRGLGSVVMRMLASHAVRLGADTGVLVATDDGHRLYRALGWTVRTPIAAAYIPEPRRP